MRRDLTNAEIADRLSLFAALLELADRSPFAVRSYLRAAELVRSSPGPIADLVREGRARELRGIGPGIESKLRELVETGDLAELAELEAATSQLDRAAAEGRLREVSGIGPVTEQRILAALAAPRTARRGLTLDRSRPLAEAIASSLGGVVAGAPRRFCELAHELTVVVAARDPGEALDRFAGLPQVVTILERGADHAVGLTVEGVPVSVHAAPPASFGTALFRATGSDEYVRALEPLPEAPDEDELYARLGLDPCPPELRERAGALATAGLVELADVRGDLHCHTTWSDGRASVAEMARAARARGYEYLAICDHTPNVRVVPGLDARELERQALEIEAVNEVEAPFRVLRGVECDLRADGSLDVEERVLGELEWVQLSLHAGQRRSASELTRIVTEAMRHPAVRALSHPTGRLLNRRPENAVDLDEVFAVALETGVAVEVNGLPDRLDLSADRVREALEAGVDLVLNSDAHSTRGLERLELAVATARKGGATRGSVVNARGLDAILGLRAER
jgi:DNA polymerase (family 10)